MIKVTQKKYIRKLIMCQKKRSWLKIAATQNLASNENDYLDVADHFWRGVEEGILPPPFWWGERWRGGKRNFWRGVKKGVPSEKSGGYPSLAHGLVRPTMGKPPTPPLSTPMVQYALEWGEPPKPSKTLFLRDWPLSIRLVNLCQNFVNLRAIHKIAILGAC